MFAQLDSPVTGSQRGLGIGLTLAKTLVELHGGQIAAASEGPGRGSQFTVHLPLATAPPKAILKPAPLAANRPPLPAYRVLVVDDNEPAAFLLSRLLQMLGQHALAVNSGAAALEAVHDFQPQIIFSDIAMPHMDGYELARQLRSAATLPQPVLIALTGYGQESDRQEASDAGFDQHLTKPIGLPTLEQLLRSLQKPEAS
jgi:CheY-like chemotaxis protein